MSGQKAICKAQLLDWQIAMGADEAVGDERVDWFERSSQKKPATSLPEKRRAPIDRVPAKPAPTPASAARPVASPDDSIGDARKLAQGCNTVDELITALERFTACPLSRTATNLCFIDGNRDARILLIGEAPGRDEDLQGKPFVGRSGRLLDKMLKFIDLDRASDKAENSVLICNTVFWRPPGNRKPTEAETLMCLPFVSRLIGLTKPEFIVCLGGTPTQRLTGQTKGITWLRGRWFSYQTGGDEIPVLATLHPSYLLRQPVQKSLAWQDLLALKTKIAAK
jgi:DNA polymerase